MFAECAELITEVDVFASMGHAVAAAPVPYCRPEVLPAGGDIRLTQVRTLWVVMRVYLLETLEKRGQEREGNIRSSNHPCVHGLWMRLICCAGATSMPRNTGRGTFHCERCPSPARLLSLCHLDRAKHGWQINIHPLYRYDRKPIICSKAPFSDPAIFQLFAC